MMEFEGEFTVDGTPDELWKYFTDPDILQDCAPGCESMTMHDPSHFTADLAVGVGSVKPSFDVDGVVTEADAPNRLELKASGEASRNSFQVTAWQELTDNGDGTTTVNWKADAQVSGIIASMGERALGSVADKLVNDFFRDLEDHATAGTPAESRFEAASTEEIEAAGFGAEAEEEAAAAESGTGSDLAGKAIGTAMEATSGDRTPGFYVGIGVVLGALGTALWDRLRGGPWVARAPPADAEPGGSGGRGRSLLALLVVGAIGAVGAVLWSQSRGSEDAKSPTDRIGDVVASVTSDEPAADEVAVDETEREVETAAETAGSSGSGTGGVTADPESDDPLDRLESR